MKLFSKREEGPIGLVGVDIGAGGMKVVELVPHKTRLRLSTYGYSETTSAPNGRAAFLDRPDLGAQVLKRIVKDAGIKSTRANASLPSHEIFYAIITIPRPKEKSEVDGLVRAQAGKLLPKPIEEMVLDFTVIDTHLLLGAKKVGPAEKKDEAQHIRVLVSGAAKDLVAKYVELFKYAGLELASLETEAFALIRSLIGKDKSRVLIADIGFERTTMTIVQSGIPFLHRSIKTGGAQITEMIAKRMGITADEAEQAKLDMSQMKGGDVPKLLQNAFVPIVNEIKYSLQLYNQQDAQTHEVVEKVIVTGGSAHLPYLDPFLTQELNMNVYLGDPWARIVVPQGLRPVLDDLGARFAVSVGLAMKQKMNLDS